MPLSPSPPPDTAPVSEDDPATSPSQGELSEINGTVTSALSDGASDSGDASTALVAVGVSAGGLLLAALGVIAYCAHKRRQVTRRSRTGGPMPFAVPAVKSGTATVQASAPVRVEGVPHDARGGAYPAMETESASSTTAHSVEMVGGFGAERSYERPPWEEKEDDAHI